MKQAVYSKLILSATILIVLLIWSSVYAGIVTTKHNLSATGPGPIKAVSEQRVCVFCHAPHNALTVGPLWNHSMSSAAYTLYKSGTLKSPTDPAIQPDRGARLCLSCHDGTIAIGAVVNSGGASTTISMQATPSLDAQGKLAAGTSSNLGTNISGHHPVSIEVNSSLITAKNDQCVNNLIAMRVCTPPSASAVKLKATDNQYSVGPRSYVGVQCSSCHDPHNDPTPGTTKFLVLGDKNNYDALCNTCHRVCSSACP